VTGAAFGCFIMCCSGGAIQTVLDKTDNPGQVDKNVGFLDIINVNAEVCVLVKVEAPRWI
jgi:hypothetical protein